MSQPSYSPSFEEFQRFAAHGNLIPLYREILGDLETPVSAFSKIDHGPSAYLLESVEGGDNWGRYSFLGSGAPLVLREEGGTITYGGTGGRTQGRGTQQPKLEGKGTPLEQLHAIMARFHPVTVPGLPRFVGGAVGYLSYDIARHFEDIGQRPKDTLGLPELAFIVTDTLLIFDNVAKTIKVVANAHIEKANPAALRRAYVDARRRIEKIIARLKRPLCRIKTTRRRRPITFSSNMSRADFKKMVVRTKEYIRAGDVVQTVVSQRWEAKIHVPSFQIYRALRMINPSPYMYYLRVGGLELVGSSPEILVRCEEGKISLRPIAGTRTRGVTGEQDQQREHDLLQDDKERAEHVMLVDLGRNDVGRVATVGTVRVADLLHVERYSHVMHLVSQVYGDLDPKHQVYDVMQACFPAGTVSGAPKIRAMQIIDELEPTRRGPYAGAVGYFSFSGNMDTCINIRTILIKDRKAYIQAGAGIVADSIPEREYEETYTKARAMMRAIEMAEQGLE